MSVLDKLLILKEKTILITGEKMKLNVAYEVKRSVKTVSKWDKTQQAVIAYLRLTDTATGEYAEHCKVTERVTRLTRLDERTGPG